MAIYYKWIKGCSDTKTTITKGEESVSFNFWNYVKWGQEYEYNKEIVEIVGIPKIYSSEGRNDDTDEKTNSKDLGYILTTKIPHIVEEQFTFVQGIKINEYNVIADPTYGGIIVDSNLGTAGELRSGTACHAPYFNATSDRRAKENITPSTYKALDTIMNTPVMDYNYINNPDRVTGIIAQDLLKTQPEGLDLVSGLEEEMLSIKTDKIMFIMWKAIQEQQEQIKDLQNQINELKNK